MASARMMGLNFGLKHNMGKPANYTLRHPHSMLNRGFFVPEV